MSAPTPGEATPVDAHAVVGAHRALHHTGLRNGELDHHYRVIGGFHGGLLHTVLHTDGTISWVASGVASNLGQYITPMVTLQAVAFAAMSICLPGGDRFAAGRQSTVQVHADRPIDAGAARVSASVYRCCVGLTVALICGHAIGFRFHHGASYIAGFCVLVIVDRGLAVIRRGPDRHRYQEPGRDAAVADLAYC